VHRPSGRDGRAQPQPEPSGWAPGDRSGAVPGSSHLGLRGPVQAGPSAASRRDRGDEPGGNHTERAERPHRPTTLEKLQEIVAAALAGEIRTVAADRLWMSTAYDQASVAPPLRLEAHSGRSGGRARRPRAEPVVTRGAPPGESLPGGRRGNRPCTSGTPTSSAWPGGSSREARSENAWLEDHLLTSSPRRSAHIDGLENASQLMPVPRRVRMCHVPLGHLIPPALL